MLTPASLLPPNEAERLATLRHYDFTCVAPDDILNELLALSATIFNQPLAFLALVDEQEVRFPALYGRPPVQPLPRVNALCSTAILHPNALAYENLAVAAQTGADAPAIRSAMALGAAFYAAAPLRMPDGQTIGVLCLIGQQPRPFSPTEQEALTALADVTSLAIAVRHMCLATPELGTEQWDAVCHRLRPDMHSLHSLLGELLTQHGTLVPVPPAVLQQVQQRLQMLPLILAE
ncbi:GAF domain-containing protein [Hymenobacter sp. B1770]|uniref:GAF domain-containing protein n=1 Tax=Hymenobacter sp. B1770 TaxID=1718788 RepID=UPI003CE9791B